jgi:hypothetical protein
VLESGTKPTATAQPTLESGVQHGAAAGGGVKRAPRPNYYSAHAKDQAFAEPLRLTPNALPPSTTRLNKYNAWLTVRVDDDRLAKATTRAMQIARGYGGYVASVDMNTPGKRGTASLVLRVPVTKVEDAVLRLGQLGDVTAQRVRIQDLQREANVLERQILKLRATISSLEHRLADKNLSTDERLRLRYQLDEAKQSLAAKVKSRATTMREGTLATVSLTFTTPKPAVVVPHQKGRLERTIGDAASFLVRELSWLLYLLIVVGPIALLAAIGVFAVRSARRRSDQRLLEGA